MTLRQVLVYIWKCFYEESNDFIRLGLRKYIMHLTIMLMSKEKKYSFYLTDLDKAKN